MQLLQRSIISRSPVYDIFPSGAAAARRPGGILFTVGRPRGPAAPRPDFAAKG